MSENKLTPLQRTTLQAAAIRNDLSAWPVRGKINVGTATRTVKQLVRTGLVIERPAGPKSPIWREDDDGRSLMAVITAGGLEAVGMLPAGKKARSTRPAGKKGAVAAERAAVPTAFGKKPREPRRGSKLAALAELLQRKEGATIADMMASTGWQAHSVRGVLSATLTKQFGVRIVSEKAEGRDRVYRQQT